MLSFLCYAKRGEKMNADIKLPNGSVSVSALASCLLKETTPDPSFFKPGAIVVRNFEIIDEYAYDFEDEDLYFYDLDEAINYIRAHTNDRLRIMKQNGEIIYDYF